ncbi:NF-kappa-B inhibitor cactus-like [Phymastichus coffea]|uniref:NF-kappa-B inhibitor cactus-like n=1 Tax=Phymastichus coffea TaxID=108790 RepID=UPI00273AE911|nr:NF-kappa-B inhibitor cactus-like [Phymastichus coffea]
MWQQQPTQKFDNLDKCCMESGTSDSGFLSCSNSALNSCTSEFDSNSMDCSSVMKNSKNEMDFNINDSFNQLSLDVVPLNPLQSTKGCLETKSESDSGIISLNTSSGHNGDDQEPWQLYYTQNEDGDTLLHVAIIQGFIEASLSLISISPHPCLLDILNDDIQTALHLAVMTNQPEIVRKLVLAGADISIRNHQGNTALHLACISGDLACTKALTEPYAENKRNFSSKKLSLPQILELRNYNGQTCVHIAASKDQLHLVRILIDAGADLEAQEYLAGRTALHLALEYGCGNVVSFLIRECRLSFDAVTYAGYTAYDIASCIDESLAKELVRYGAIPSQHVTRESQEYGQTMAPIFATACGV